MLRLAFASHVWTVDFPVSVTAMSRSAAAFVSVDAFIDPVEAISLSVGSCCRISLVSGVRPPMTHTTSNSRNHWRSIGDMIAEPCDLGLPSDV
jgi:hypothetical protein